MRLFYAALFLLASSPALADVYLLSRHKLEGTDFTAAYFLSHPQMTTLEACEAERKAARTTGFRLFSRLYFATHKGRNLQDQLYCVESDQRFTPFRPNPTVDFTYLITLDKTKMKVKRAASLGACMAMTGQDGELSSNRFCAKSPQDLTR